MSADAFALRNKIYWRKRLRNRKFRFLFFRVASFYLDRSFCIEFPVLSGDINLCNWRESGPIRSIREERCAEMARKMLSDRKEKEKLQETSQSQSREEMKNFLHLDSPQSIPGFFISTVGVEDRKRKFLPRVHFSI